MDDSIAAEVTVSQSGELEEVLEDLYSAGEFDSSGSFYLRTDKALEKLGDFQLEHPHHYICHLLSGAFLSGASSVEVEMGLWQSRLWFPGCELGRSFFEDPYSYIFRNPSNRREWARREMAIGMLSARSGGVKDFQLEYPDVKPQAWEEGGSVRSLSEGAGLSVELKHQRGWLRGCYMFLTGALYPEVSALQSSMVFESMPVSVSWGKRHWQAPSEDDVRAQVRPKGVLASLEIEDGEVTYGVSGELGKKADSRLHLSVRGRHFQVPLRLGRARVWAWLRADSLPLDLSQRGPRQGAELLALQQRVARAVTELQYRLVLSEEKMEGRAWREICRQLSRGLRTEGRTVECLTTLRRLRREHSRRANVMGVLGRFEEAEEALHEELGDSGLPSGLRPSRWMDLATVQAQLGKREAMATWRRAYEVIRGRHLNRKDHLLGEALERKLVWSCLFQSERRSWKQWENALELKAHLGESHYRLSSTYELGSYLSLKFGRLSRAFELAEKAEGIRSEKYGPGNPILGQPLTLKSLAAWKLGTSDEAVALAQKRFVMMKTVYGEEHPETAASLNLLSLIQGGGKEHRRRARQILEAREIWEAEGQITLCFRGWFHSRVSWFQPLPLTWAYPETP